MSLADIFIWYTSICAFIFVIFELVEKFSNKSDLELYYLLITIKRTSPSRPWHAAMIAFLDRIFGQGRPIGDIVLPKISRVIFYTTTIHLILFLFIIFDGRGSIKGNLTLFTVSWLICIVLDFIVFAKTRLLLQLSSRKSSLMLVAIYSILDINIILILIAISVVIFGLTITFLTFGIPEITARILQIDIALRDGRPDWNETFYVIGLTGTPFVILIILINFISAFASTLIIVIFILGLIISNIKEKIPSLQNFVDNHTSVQEKPLQILGFFSVCSFTLIFWIIYALGRFLGLIHNS